MVDIMESQFVPPLMEYTLSLSIPVAQSGIQNLMHIRYTFASSPDTFIRAHVDAPGLTKREDRSDLYPMHFLSACVPSFRRRVQGGVNAGSSSKRERIIFEDVPVHHIQLIDTEWLNAPPIIDRPIECAGKKSSSVLGTRSSGI